MSNGNCRVITIDPQDRAHVADATEGDLWYFPVGCALPSDNWGVGSSHNAINGDMFAQFDASHSLLNSCPACHVTIAASSSHLAKAGSLDIENSVSLMRPKIKQASLYSPSIRFFRCIVIRAKIVSSSQLLKVEVPKSSTSVSIVIISQRSANMSASHAE